MNMTADEFGLMPIGFFLGLWACHKQFLGLEEAKRDVSVDDVIPV
jgi:hypothetical protein